jgi:hypothetical protein
VGDTALALKEWESFYVIVGSSAGALAGLQFVVLTLIQEAGTVRGSGETISAFGSPNVVHFCAALLVAAICSAPWHSLGPLGVVVALCGACGFVYSILVLRRALLQNDYKPVLEDWIWHEVLPMLAYAALIAAGLLFARLPVDALFIVAGAALLLVFIGIHNAWDTVMYITVARVREQRAAAAAMQATEPSPRTESLPAVVRNAAPPGAPKE